VKKLFFIPLAIFLMIILLLPACGQATTTPTTTTPTATKPTATVTPSSTPTTTTTPTATQPTATATPTPTSEITRGGTLQFVYPYSPGSTPGWPNENSEFQRLWMEWMVYEPLIKLDRNAEPMPWLATAWEWGPDNLYVTFTLRQGVKFTDGTEFTSEAVKLEGDLVISTAQSNAITWDRWEIIGDYTVRLYLKEYLNNFWGSVAGINMCFFSPTAYNAHQPDGQAYIKENPIGTGPFKLVSFEKDVSMKFVKNDNYWQAGKPYLDGIDFITVKEDLTAQAMMDTGEGDLLALKQGKVLDDMKKKGFTILYAYGGTDFIMFDTANPDSIFNDVQIRMAVEYAINKEAMANALGYGYFVANNQMPPPDNPAYNSALPSRDFDVDKAKELLGLAGHPNGIDVTMIVMGTSAKDLAIQEYLSDAGIRVTFDVVDNPKFWNYMMTGWTGMVSTGYAVGTNFPSWIKSYFPPTGIFDVSVKIPDAIWAKLDPAMRESDPVKAKELSDEIIQMLFDDCTMVPVYSNAMGFVLNPKVQGSGIESYVDWSVWDPADTWLSE
jgi:peptide/nickel transport system substrate-binding protein